MDNNYDVLLINPPSTVMENFEHLGLGYLAACLRKRQISVKILNLPKHTVKSALSEVKKHPVKIVGISVPFQEAAVYAFDLASALKRDRPGTHISVGGIYPTFSYKEILTKVPSIDSVVLGEGEETFTELAEYILRGRDWHHIKGIAYREDNNITVTEARPLIANLDELPYPERDTLPEVLKKTNFAPVLSSRGCYGRCTFCSVVPFFAQYGPKYRLRSSENVMGELEQLYNRYNVRNVEFNDANFIGGKGRGYKRAGEIAEEIIKRDMDLKFSIQCRPDDVDKELFKRLMGFITFDDRITFKELGENLAFIQRAKSIIPANKLSFNLVSKVIPLAGTEVEKCLIQTNKLRGNSLRNSYRLDNPAMELIYNTLKSLLKVSLGLRRGLNFGYSKQWLKRS